MLKAKSSINWKEFDCYEAAKDCRLCLYVFRKHKKPLYIGKAKQFGGPTGRYAYGYRYLVDALIKSGCRLYIAELSTHAWKRVDNYENTLICKYRWYLVNKRKSESLSQIKGLSLPWKISDQKTTTQSKKSRARK